MLSQACWEKLSVWHIWYLAILIFWKILDAHLSRISWSWHSLWASPCNPPCTGRCPRPEHNTNTIHWWANKLDRMKWYICTTWVCPCQSWILSFIWNRRQLMLRIWCMYVLHEYIVWVEWARANVIRFARCSTWYYMHVGHIVRPSIDGLDLTIIPLDWSPERGFWREMETEERKGQRNKDCGGDCFNA